IDKDEANVVVDVVKEIVIKQPKENLITEVNVNGDFLILRAKAKELKSSVSFSQIKDADGKVIQSQHSYHRFDAGQGYVEIGNQINGLSKINGPLTFEIASFPTYIEANQKIKIK